MIETKDEDHMGLICTVIEVGRRPATKTTLHSRNGYVGGGDFGHRTIHFPERFKDNELGRCVGTRVVPNRIGQH